ncbi:MAG: redoxin domain-containing protein [Bacteroidales bacterium]|nr:redoxin domain-containing protein [Bacteroidales bacterium]
MKKFFVFFVVFSLAVSTFAQKTPHKIEVKVNGVKDTTLLLGYHYGAKKLVSDTIWVDSKGKGVFAGDSLLDGGLYLVLTPDYRYFEIVIDNPDQTFKIETDTSDLFGKLKIEGSESNTVFLQYQKKSSEMYKVRKPALEALKALYAEDTTKMNKKRLAARRDSIKTMSAIVDSVRDVMVAYENDIRKTYPSSLLASILGCTHEVEIPDYPRDENGNITDSLFKYTYMKKHYFDNINLGDERLLRTPVYESKIDDYFDKQLIQIPDSIIPQVDFVMGQILAQENKGYEGKMYYNTLHHLFMKYQNPKYMGLDNIFVHIMANYYLNGHIPARVANDTAYMNKIKDRYEKMVNNQIGVHASDMLVYKMGQDTLDENMGWTRLSMVKSKYVVIYFWDTDCGHCKKIVPEWHKLYRENEFKKKGVESFMVYTQTDMEKWKKFIAEQDMFDFINVFDPYQNTNFRTNYDIYSTPVVYVLDKERKIIAKRLPPETVVDLLNHELEKDAKEAAKKK